MSCTLTIIGYASIQSSELRSQSCYNITIWERQNCPDRLGREPDLSRLSGSYCWTIVKERSWNRISICTFYPELPRYVSLNWLGVIPVEFLNMLLNVDLELNPASKAMAVRVNFENSSLTSSFFTSSTRYSLIKV